MPPRRLRQSSAEPDAGPEPPGSDPSESRSSVPADIPASQVLPIFNTTFTLHRVSPLYVGSTGLTSLRLNILSSRLRDVLVGDVVRGIDLGGGLDPGLSTAGALLAVSLEWISVPFLLGEGDDRRALMLELKYENASSTGFLLPSSANATEGMDGDAFVSLPLMLLRMPAAVKAAVVDLFASTFDCRVTSLRLGSADIARCWEAWIRDAGLPRRGPLAKDCAITVGFDLSTQAEQIMGRRIDDGGDDSKPSDVPSGLKCVDIILANEDLRKFAKAGEALLDGETGSAAEKQPFMRALKEYGSELLAFDFGHPAVRIVRIACGGFVLGGERLKIFPAEEDAGDDTPHVVAVRQLLALLVDRTSGWSGKELAGRQG